jgi:hypothetical protein
VAPQLFNASLYGVTVDARWKHVFLQKGFIQRQKLLRLRDAGPESLLQLPLFALKEAGGRIAVFNLADKNGSASGPSRV